jgi:hypothetical protein
MNSCIFIFTLLEHFFDLACAFSQAMASPWWNCYPWNSINMSFFKKYIPFFIYNTSISTNFVYPSTYLTSQLSWCQICSRSSPTHQHCFNFISSYRTPIDMKSVGLVPEFNALIAIQNSAILVFYPGRYIRISGALRICQHCWHSHLV